MFTRRLEDRIRELCAKAVIAPEGEIDAVLADLKNALREHNFRVSSRLESLAAQQANGLTPQFEEKRKN